MDLARWALRTSPKFTTGVKYLFHQGFWLDQRSGNLNHPSPPAGPGSIPGRDKFPGWGFFVVFITCANDLRCWRALKPKYTYIHTYIHTYILRKATGSYRTYSFLVKYTLVPEFAMKVLPLAELLPWFLSLRCKTFLWAELQPWFLNLQWKTERCVNIGTLYINNIYIYILYGLVMIMS